MQWLKELLAASKETDAAVLGVEISPAGLTAVQLDQLDSPAIHLKNWQFIPCDEKGWPAALETLCDDPQCHNASLYLCFTPEFYELLLIDAPQVEDDELTQAVRWRVKDLLSGDVDDYVIEAFRLPADAYRGRMNMLYTACIARQYIQLFVDLCEDLPVTLVEISISELVRCRLFNQPAYAQQGLALLDLGDNGKGKINLMERALLYLSRNVDAEFDTEQLLLDEEWSEQTMKVDSLALDIQRSLDYYESQLGKAGINRLYLLANQRFPEPFCKALDQQIATRIDVLELSDFVQGDVAKERVSSCCSAIGAALGAKADA